ncbi:extracellular solute-binding protein [Paenibacillus thiaminolyticus]|uniref:Extracellular solute-binding protein n=1 Tax=Paenibacillus thiaminolyticus TaxID=49283 RepID=A0AAP9J1T3_PANTH|nr:extracellular solute-binding protein [Paenibacillus thiaminolyticus]MCY9534258.1 extracellular solute-binding protein [Paenibacillus thiaminolyticus]MCY9602969.1 extracellular solute-binding protein [Paenibacillus thiaminolyticus]MCY9608200.1 extracellular solute-binding protein [Paenibacillus thiaminolyticus]MCY9611568.1 extracellular solute-binding protein [Paenibacillus thiaminolyticus]MCY9618304.1 extracellular solute-binding protein [Paenibacillus thiaminolyticus]
MQEYKGRMTRARKFLNTLSVPVRPLFVGGKLAVAAGICCSLALSLAGCHAANVDWMKAERDRIDPSITIVMNSLGIRFPEPWTENDNPYLSYIEDETGLEVEVIIPPWHRYEERVGVMMMSSHTPDLIGISDPNWVSHYARKQMLAPLDHLIERYAPQLKKRIPAEVWEQVSFNGQVYAIPSLNEAKGLEMMYIRKDWLDRLGLAPPETIEETVEVMRAFAAFDPDGNGIRNTYGTSFIEDFGRSSPWFGAFGVQLNQWAERDGKLVYSNILPEMKDALAFMRGLVAEGLIDPLFPIQTQRGLERQVIDGRIGLFTGTWYDTRGVLEKSAARDPQADWITLPYPQGPGGTGTYGLPTVRSYQVIPATSPHAVEVLQLLNFISGEGRDTLKFGFEGEVWEWKDGQRVTDMGMHNRDQYRGLYANLADIPESGYVRSRLDSLGSHYHLYDNLRHISPYAMPDAFQSLPTPAMTRYAPLLAKKNDRLIEIVLGERPLDDFDTYAAEWLAEGGEEMTREANAWFQYSRNQARREADRDVPAHSTEGSDRHAPGAF